MVTDRQVRQLWRELESPLPLNLAARRAGMSEKTARQYRDRRELPSSRKAPRTYRTRIDPFAEVWIEVEQRLQAEPRLTAKTLFDWLRGQHPGKFLDSHRRTFERRVRQWRALNGPNRPVVFRQVHEAGDLAASDFTSMNSLAVTIAREPFDHLVYHFVLTYSHWESITVCVSESFEALSEGFQSALWEWGGVPRRHRSDSLSAAVNHLSATREFPTRYRDLLTHYGLSGQRINVRQPHENGDAESSHGHFKTAADQALLLRGSRDFATREEYGRFLHGIVETRNAGRVDRFAEERRALRNLPDQRLSSCLKVRCRVDTGSLIHLHRNTSSVHRRLIGEEVEARLFAGRVEVWFADRQVDTLPRLVGRDQHAVHDRHVIDSLIRKPGAFANYAYRDDRFPTTRFRLAYDRFRDGHDERLGTKEYLTILHHAAPTSEQAVDDALRVLLPSDALLTAEAIIALARSGTELPPPTEVRVEPPNRTDFDALLHFTEETHGQEPNPLKPLALDGRASDRTTPGVAIADVPGTLPDPGRPSGEGGPELPAVPGSVDEPRMRGPLAGPDSPAGSGVAVARGQDVGPVPVASVTQVGAATVAHPSRWRVPDSPRERPGFRQARLGETPTT
jgi:hypothetical protein